MERSLALTFAEVGWYDAGARPSPRGQRVRLGHQHGELHAAEPASDEEARQAGDLADARHAADQFVFAGMAVGVVDLLEIIDVDDEQRERAAIALRAPQLTAASVIKCRGLARPKSGSVSAACQSHASSDNGAAVSL